MKNPNADPYFALGASIASEHMGLTPGDVIESSSFFETLYKSASFRDQVDLAVQGIYVILGKGGSLERYAVKAAFDLEREGNQEAKEICDEIMDCFMEIGFSTQGKSASAGALAGILAKLGLTTGRGALSGLVYGAGLAGAGLGTIGWALNRDVNQDRADNEALQAQIDAYNRMTNEIRRKLKDRGIEVDEQDERDIKAITGAERVVARRG